MAKSTQTSNTQDRNNCTVMALKSVTGWQERKCSRILTEGGRKQNKGFDIEGYIADNKGKIDTANFEIAYAKYDSYAKGIMRHKAAIALGIEPNSKEYWQAGRELYIKANEMAIEAGFSMVNYEDKPMTLKRFAKENPKGAFYILVRGHALAIIDGIIVDNLQGKCAGEGRQIIKAYKVTGKIKPNTGIVTKYDTNKKKRHARLKYGEQVIYIGKPIKYQGETLAKKGDRVYIQTQQGNGIVVLEFSKPATQYKPHPTIKGLRKPLDGYVLKCKRDRSDFQVTKERKTAMLSTSRNLIK